MLPRGPLFAVLLLAGALCAALPTIGRGEEAKLRSRMVWVWTLGKTPEAEVVRLARALGFNAMQARNVKMVEECRRAGVAAFAAVWLGSAPAEFAQVMLPEEEERLRARKARPAEESRYQQGGEPVDPGEVSDLKCWCLDRPEALAFGKGQIDRAIEQGYDGIALDAVGYSNYHACFCPVSRERHAAYRKEHPELPETEAVHACSLERLVGFYADLSAYARERKPGIATTCHVYPHFAPEPLYGNRLDLDTCGQTVSWFFLPHWPLEKVARHSRALVEGEGRYHPKAKAAPFLAIYSLPPQERHRKSAERVRREIRAVKEAGATAIQLAELGHILNDPEVAKVVSEELGGTWPALP